MMDTLVEISFTTRRKNVREIMDNTIDLIAEYEKKLSYYDDKGELWRINHAEQDSVEIDYDFYELFSLAEIFYHQTEGYYDITVGALTDLWDFDRTYPPPADSIAAALENVSFTRISFKPGYLIRPPGIKINLGSIAKGFIIDKAIEYAVSQEVTQGYINAGGDIRLFSDDDKEQLIGIQHPRDINDLIDILSVANKAIVTSGDYERFFEYQGRRYHHIINPVIGYPVENIYSVTVIAPNTLLADIMSTAIFLLPPDEGIALVKSYPETEAIIYFQEANQIVSLRTEGIRKYIRE
jgi:thiamine biosynthesis lipoprotein